MEELQYHREALNKDGSNTEAVDRLVFQIASSEIEEAKKLLATLESEANKLGWPRDRDYAAVALQAASSKATKLVFIEMIEFAINRAKFCASCATAGGEGIARSMHIHELENLLKTHNS